MKKLRLDLGALRVESFQASAVEAAPAGTVHANSDEPVDPSGVESCDVTLCATCYCPHTGPQPSCDPCSWMDCFSFNVDPCGG